MLIPLKRSPCSIFFRAQGLFPLLPWGATSSAPSARTVISPSSLAKRAILPEKTFCLKQWLQSAVRNGCRSISYTYTEPTIYLEYALDTAVAAKEQGLFNVMVTNGYTTTEVIGNSLKGTIHAANIDLKAFTEGFYKKLCSARLAPVLDAIKAYHDAGIWIEITTLIIPGENDSDEELRDIASFIYSISPDIPWHISRYYPRYKYDQAPPTPINTIEKAREIGLSEGLHFVYSGNVMGHDGENTYCPDCKKLIIARKGFVIEHLHMRGHACGYCKHTIPGRFH